MNMLEFSILRYHRLPRFQSSIDHGAIFAFSGAFWVLAYAQVTVGIVAITVAVLVCLSSSNIVPSQAKHSPFDVARFSGVTDVS